MTDNRPALDDDDDIRPTVACEASGVTMTFIYTPGTHSVPCPSCGERFHLFDVDWKPQADRHGSGRDTGTVTLPDHQREPGRQAAGPQRLSRLRYGGR